MVTDPDAFLEYGIELTRKVYVMANHSRAMEIYESLLIQAQARSIFFTSVCGCGRVGVLVQRGGIARPTCATRWSRDDADAAVATSNAGLDQFEALDP